MPPVEEFCTAHLKVSLLCTCNINDNLSFFDNFKLDDFDAAFLSATLPRLDCIQANFRVSSEMQNSFLVVFLL